MAYLGNTLINGSLRCLNKAYFNDLSVSDTMTVASLSTTGNATIGGTLGVTGATTIAGTLTLTKTTDVSGTANNSPALIIGGTATGKHIEIDLDEIQAKTNGTSVGDLWINNDGGTVYIKNLNSTKSTITTGNITTLKASTATADNLTVNNVLKSSKWDISNVANLANDFMVAPTIKMSSSGTVTIASLNTTAKTCRLTFSDSSQINSDEFGGCRWYAGSKVRVTFTVSGTLNSNIEGTIVNNMNTTAGTLVVDVTLDNTTNLANGTYEADDSTIMLYEISNSGTLSPVGIRMTAYGTNNSSYIDMYGGTTASSYTQPVFRIGNLNGITYNGETLSAQWGVYTYNGYFEGAIVANEGKIGGLTIDTDKMYSNGHSTYGANVDGIFIDDTYISFGKLGATILKNDGTGYLGGWNFDKSRLYNGTIGGTYSVLLSKGYSSSIDIGGSGAGTSRIWAIAVSNKFGVTYTGQVFANDISITGDINARTLHVGESTSANHLIYENSTIDLQTDWLKFNTSTNTVEIGKSNAPRAYIDGSSFKMLSKENSMYFQVKDKRSIYDGLYRFDHGIPDYIECHSSDELVLHFQPESNSGISLYEYDNLTSVSFDSVSGKIIYGTFEIGKIYAARYATSEKIFGLIFGNNSTSGPNASSFAEYGSAEGLGSIATGYGTEATGAYSFASGDDSLASGRCSYANGYRTTASGNYSFSLGRLSIASGSCAYSSGYQTTASGNYSISSGEDTIASGTASIATGYGTEATGAYTSANGYCTIATADYQTVIGKYNARTSSTDSDGNTTYDAGDYAFVIGNGNYGNGNPIYSNALTVGWDGNLTCTGIANTGNISCVDISCEDITATGKVNNVDLYCISTEGTLASSNYQTAIGKYNVEDTNNTYAFIIGNGTSDSNRSNALTVDWNGYIKIYNPYITVETAPSSNNTNMAVQVCDKNGSRIGHFGYSYSTDGKIGISLQGYRNVNGTNHYNTLNLLHDTNGNAVVSLSNPNAWKDALNLRLNYRHIDMGTNKHLQLASTDSYPTFFIYGTGSGLSPFMASIILNTTGGSITVADNKVSITGSGKNSGYTLTFPGNYFQLNIISFNPFTATVSA